jgi:outer membrane lipoprotein-sorting protein
MTCSYFFESIFLICFLGCAQVPQTPQTISTQTIESATLETLTQKINQFSSSVQSIKGAGLFGFQSYATAPLKNCQGVLLFKKPDSLLLQTYTALVPHYFSILTHQGNFWFYFPRRKTVYTGRYQDLLKQDLYDIQFQPQDLLKVFLPEPITDKDVLKMETRPEEYWISIFSEAQVLKRQLVINRRGLVITKESYFFPQGLVELEILRNDYVQQGEMVFPKNISARRVGRDSRFYITFQQLELNPALADNVFEFKQPQDVEIEEIKS